MVQLMSFPFRVFLYIKAISKMSCFPKISCLFIKNSFSGISHFRANVPLILESGFFIVQIYIPARFCLLFCNFRENHEIFEFLSWKRFSCHTFYGVKNTSEQTRRNVSHIWHRTERTKQTEREKYIFKSLSLQLTFCVFVDHRNSITIDLSC